MKRSPNTRKMPIGQNNKTKPDRKTIAGKYEILKKLASGGFGTVFLVRNIESREKLAIKMENKRLSNILHYEYKLLNYLKNTPQIPRIEEYGETKTHNYLSMQYLGSSLLHYHLLCSKQFDLPTISLLAIQCLTALENVHKKYIIHRDLKPENFVFNEKTQTVYLIDFGLSKRYVDNRGEHMKLEKNKRFRGTLRYASVNMHKGIENSRRDDLESLGYVLVYLANGYLPWQLRGINAKNRDQLVARTKMLMKPRDLCKDVHPCFLDYFNYVLNLKFEEKPHYDYLRSLFESVLSKFK